MARRQCEELVTTAYEECVAETTSARTPRCTSVANAASIVSLAAGLQDEDFLPYERAAASTSLTTRSLVGLSGW